MCIFYIPNKFIDGRPLSVKVRLCVDGEWQIILLDDYFPCNSDGRCMTYPETASNVISLAFSQAKNGQMWVSLAEKAFAKVFSCYNSLTAGNAREALAMLTGQPCEAIDLTEMRDVSFSTRTWHTHTHTHTHTPGTHTHLAHTHTHTHTHI